MERVRWVAWQGWDGVSRVWCVGGVGRCVGGLPSAHNGFCGDEMKCLGQLQCQYSLLTFWQFEK